VIFRVYRIPLGGIKNLMNVKIINRLKRNKGQIEALLRLVENQEDCEKILLQFQAAQSALDGAFRVFLEENLEQCLQNNDHQKIQKLLPLILKK